MSGPYYVDLNQTDPPESETPGSGHYAGEIIGFDTATDALSAGVALLGRTIPDGLFHPCCDWQSQDTPVSSVVVYREDDDGVRVGDEIATARWKGST